MLAQFGYGSINWRYYYEKMQGSSTATSALHRLSRVFDPSIWKWRRAAIHRVEILAFENIVFIKCTRPKVPTKAPKRYSPRYANVKCYYLLPRHRQWRVLLWCFVGLALCTAALGWNGGLQRTNTLSADPDIIVTNNNIRRILSKHLKSFALLYWIVLLIQNPLPCADFRVALLYFGTPHDPPLKARNSSQGKNALVQSHERELLKFEKEI